MIPNSPPIDVRIVPSTKRNQKSPFAVSREFLKRVDGASQIAIPGKAKNDIRSLLARGLRPKHQISLFDTDFFLTNVKQIPELRFFVAYVAQPGIRGDRIYARIFYKDLSLCWRSASHFAIEADGAIWVGKGSVRDIQVDGETLEVSIESTTDLPLEIQSALENLLAYTKHPSGTEEMLHLVLRKGSTHRVAPFSDFEVERRLAASNPANLINDGQPVAWFEEAGVPNSLRFAKGFEPDFRAGLVEKSSSKSRLYGGKVARFRLLSKNKRIQYLFLKSPKFAWLYPPQATTVELSTYGVRTVDVVADDDLFIPPYEYHHLEETDAGLELYSQIPIGFAGAVCPMDDQKADASPWLEKLPVIKKFRRSLGK